MLVRVSMETPKPVWSASLCSGQQAEPRLSSLPLQLLLHLHVHLLPFSILAQLGCFLAKFSTLHPTYRVILIALHLVSLLVHVVRPVLGYYGNLGERIPSLSGFWILSALLHLPALLFLGLNPDIRPLPLERFVYLIDGLFSSAELVFVTVLIRKLANRQMERFRKAVLGTGGGEVGGGAPKIT